ncbi:MAG: MBL fold metallo-hydrolase [Eggerthellaceae bacterium]|nr:MBL fold metallo-hydrolase [Eggerthellaceae bacterium]
MKVTVLIENSTPSDRFCAKHGLSLFLEVEGRKILFDMGPDDSFIANAAALGIDVAMADIAFISHGHFDHGGGLPAYLGLLDRTGRNVPIYLRKNAFKAHRANTPRGLKDIGIDESIASDPRLRFVGSCETIDDQLTVISSIVPARLAPNSNAVLLEETENGFEQDPFDHELSLLVREETGVTLITGCSHCGIVNIIGCAESHIGEPLQNVVAGFHLMDPSSGSIEDTQVTNEVAKFLAERPTRYFTFHCTGLAAYSLLRDKLGERVNYLYTGSSVSL